MSRKKKCKALIIFGDDYGDNTCTFHCQLPEGHEGPHQEKGEMYGKYPYCLMWEKAMLEEEDKFLEDEEVK